jgi:hypothetical protein
LEKAEWCVLLKCGVVPHSAKPLARAVTRELPYNHPFIVQKNYIVAFVNKWDNPAQLLFISTTTKLRELTLRVVDNHFGDYTHGHLKQRVS